MTEASEQRGQEELYAKDVVVGTVTRGRTVVKNEGIGLCVGVRF